MRDYLKANLKVLPMAILFTTISVYASGTMNANSIAYNSSKVGSVQEALDTLYDSVEVTTILPVGSVVSYMGITAPENYLICDGSVYNIADYQKLAEHIKNNFGSYNYFGGDGETTFAVPDLRGEFLRGAGTNSHANQGSGANVGVHQDGTEIPLAFGTDVIYVAKQSTGVPNNVDSSINIPTGKTKYTLPNATSEYNAGTTTDKNYTARPTNTSVNYIIKVK